MSPNLTQYELTIILFGALSLGAVLAKGLLLGKEQISGMNTAFASLLGASMMVTLTHLMGTLGLVSLAVSEPISIISLCVTVLASLAIWLRLRTPRRVL